MENRKKAMLVVSFGTSYEETRDKTIGAIERELAAAFPGWEVRRAFTSAIILKVLAKRDALHIDNVPEAMERLVADGIKTLLVQPTHIINGDEYEKMLAQMKPYLDAFEDVKIGRPLLTSSADFDGVVSGLMGELPGLRPANEGLEGNEVLVLMGHGTGHHADTAYAALDYRFQDRGHTNVVVGTVEGYPGLEQLKKQVKQHRPARVVLMPFMIVAGDHATNDMAGDETDSWKNQFLREGYRVECILRGLGEFQAIRDIYLDHARKALTGE